MKEYLENAFILNSMNKAESKNQVLRQPLGKYDLFNQMKQLAQLPDVKIMMYSFYNGIYHGQTTRGKCTGRGVFWWDSGELYFGT